MNKLLNGLQENTNFKCTENGAVAHKSTLNALYDMYGLGGAYRSRNESDKILLFKNAYEENPLYALKCLFYLRDVLKGQGEREFFRVCLHWLAKENPDLFLQRFSPPLLIDEIRNGFHYSVMCSLWEVLINAAIRNNTQLFVTTHDVDSIKGLRDAALENHKDIVATFKLLKTKFEYL